MVDERALLDALRVFATRSVEDYDVADVLDEVGAQARTALGLEGAGVTLKVRQGKEETQYMSATDDATMRVERAQDRLREGLCIDAINSGHPVSTDDITVQAHRWPRYAPVVVEAGFRSVAGIPMLAGGRVIGALNAYRAQPGPWTADSLRAGTLFANVATTYIANSSVYADQATLATQLQQALDSRVIIEQAKGVLSERLGVPLDDAFEKIRQQARNQRAKLSDVAADVLSGRQTFDA